MTYLKDNWEENKKAKKRNNESLDGEKKLRNEELYGLASEGVGIRKLAKKYKISKARVYSIIIHYERMRNYKPNFGVTPNRVIRKLVKGEVISLKHAKLLGLEKLVSVEGIGPMTAARIITGQYD